MHYACNFLKDLHAGKYFLLKKVWKSLSTIMSDKAMLVLGEASESDDEDYNYQEVNSAFDVSIEFVLKYNLFQNEKNGGKNFSSSKSCLVESDQADSEDSNCHAHSSSK